MHQSLLPALPPAFLVWGEETCKLGLVVLSFLFLGQQVVLKISVFGRNTSLKMWLRCEQRRTTTKKKCSVPYWKFLAGFGRKGNLQGSFLIYLNFKPWDRPTGGLWTQETQWLPAFPYFPMDIHWRLLPTRVWFPVWLCIRRTEMEPYENKEQSWLVYFEEQRWSGFSGGSCPLLAVSSCCWWYKVFEIYRC